MPAQDLADFFQYWTSSMEDDEGKIRVPGGIIEEGGVDYAKYLIPWCKGNSVSVDQTTLRHPRDLLSMLVENYRSSLYRVDSGNQRRLDHRCGVSFDELVRMFGKSKTKRTRWHAAGDLSPDWLRLERLLQAMLDSGDIAIFSDRNTLNPQQEKILTKIRAQGRLADNMSEMYISEALSRHRDSYGHIRLSRKKGWELYIRDHYGAPSGIDGLIPGNMASFAPPGRATTMPYPLHLVYAETMARAMSRDGNVWGKNQSLIRSEISDAVIDGNGSSLPLDDFYIIHSRNGAAHMADYTLQRSIGDLAAAAFRLGEVPNSDPKSWVVHIDPDLIRWRENRRDRDRVRDSQ
ncbi:MAG TPA: hypothetical protein EYQ11_02965 [Candidatus Poseidoniales archaeon]|nr:hypothetical protein [Candidatus Poseidoniales archaeon]